MSDVKERALLIQMAILKYNRQFNHSFKAEDCDILSIPTRVNFDLSYEIYSVRFDDYLRLHIHLTFDNKFGLKDYRLENDGTTAAGVLGDEVFVAVGTIDRYYRDERIFRFAPIVPSEAALPVILMESSYAILGEDGDFLLLETATVKNGE